LHEIGVHAIDLPAAFRRCQARRGFRRTQVPQLETQLSVFIRCLVRTRPLQGGVIAGRGQIEGLEKIPLLGLQARGSGHRFTADGYLVERVNLFWTIN
jgi:hypothetical protein